MTTTIESVGDLLRAWRQRRRYSQLELAAEAGVSTRHLSFVETGRAGASREMLVRLAEQLGMPLRARNRLLLAGGFAPAHGERPLDAPDMSGARAVLDAVLAGHAPFPALAVNARWELIAANDAVARLLDGVSGALLAPPVNVLRLSLHPDGLAPRIDNLGEWRHHLLERLRLQADSSGDARLAALRSELAALPFRAGRTPPGPLAPVAVPLRLRDLSSGAMLSLLSTTTVFGTATDVTLAEITLECFYPADAPTRAYFLVTGADDLGAASAFGARTPG